MIIDKIDRFVENIEKSRERKKLLRKGKESKLKKLARKSLETYDVTVMSSTIDEFFYTYLGKYAIIIPVSMIICFYVLRNIVFRKKEGSAAKKIIGYIISAVLLILVCDWIRVGIQIFIMLARFIFLKI